MRACLVGVLLTVLVSASALAEPSADSFAFRFQDDRGETISSSLKVCFLGGAATPCAEAAHGELTASPAELLAVRIEGPDHGPIVVQRAKLKAGPDGRITIVVPRKAELQIQGKPDERITVSLYAQDDAAFRVPSFRHEAQGGGRLKVPAGEHLVSLVTAGHAPDLHFLSAPPGSQQRLAYRARSGWSLVLRILAEKDKRLLAGASVDLAGTEGFSTVEAPALHGKSGANGLILFSGIGHALATAMVDHTALVSRRINGISASPGTFTFREVELEEAARLRAIVTLDAQPAGGITCQILEYDPNPLGPAPEPVLHFEGRTDAQGVCLSGRLASGAYTLRLRVAEGRSFVDRSVSLVAGEETLAEVALTRIRVAGKVLQGSHPAPSYVITLSDMNEMKPNATRRDAQAEATTDEEGEYETSLWVPGDYVALLRSPEGTPGVAKRLRIEADEEHLDFYLEEGGVRGVVLDERGRPVAEATVYLTWNELSHRMSNTDETGAFFFPIAETGVGEIKVMKSGYVTPDLVKVEVQSGISSPTQIIRLRRAAVITGAILGSHGPAAGAVVQSYRIELGGQASFLGRSVVEPGGSFTVAAAEKGPTRLFVTGAGCPLSVFDIQPTNEEIALRCPDLPASVELTVEDRQGRPQAGRPVLMRRDGAFVPMTVLIEHLAGFHIPAATDGHGRLFLVGLAPGNYDLYLADTTSAELVALGRTDGFLTSLSLAPFTTTELKVTSE